MKDKIIITFCGHSKLMNKEHTETLVFEAIKKLPIINQKLFILVNMAILMLYLEIALINTNN